MEKHQPKDLAKENFGLERYQKVSNNVKPAKFRIAKRIKADFREEKTLEELWKEHDRCEKEFSKMQNEAEKPDFELEFPEKSYLDLKIEIAKRIMRKCRFCHHKCGVDRTAGSLGYCRCGSKVNVSSFFAHYGEEPELVPSGTIFTMGCSIRCLHCQNWTISQWKEKGTEMSPQKLAEIVDRLKREGCKNANLVGGDPTPWLAHWLETFKHVKSNIPVIWNSNSYYSRESARLLSGFADLYLLDFKYGPSNCAQRISDASNYWNVCTHNHIVAYSNGEVLIRMLILPNHLECCTRPILEWIKDNLGEKIRVNIMFQYRPEWQASTLPELRRTLSATERKRAEKLAHEVGLKNIIF